MILEMLKIMKVVRKEVSERYAEFGINIEIGAGYEGEFIYYHPELNQIALWSQFNLLIPKGEGKGFKLLLPEDRGWAKIGSL